MWEKVALAFWVRRWGGLVSGAYLHPKVFTVDETRKSVELIKANLRFQHFSGHSPSASEATVVGVRTYGNEAVMPQASYMKFLKSSTQESAFKHTPQVIFLHREDCDHHFKELHFN